MTLFLACDMNGKAKGRRGRWRPRQTLQEPSMRPRLVMRRVAAPFTTAQPRAFARERP
jgi:hypothetical protein